MISQSHFCTWFPVPLAKNMTLGYDGREELSQKRIGIVKRSSDSLLVQGSILAIAGLLTKLLGFLYRIPMANMLGEQGNGIYSVAFGIYNIALTLSSYSLPAAVSKLISERLGRGDRPGVRLVFRTAVQFALLAGACAAAVLFFGASGLETLYHRAGLSRPLRVLAPTAFVVALLGVLRGWFQGRGNMLPTAVSQVLEQVVNALVSLFATWQFLRIYRARPDQPSFGAAGGTLGTLAGAAAALIFLWLLYRWSAVKPPATQRPVERTEDVWRAMAVTVVPLMLSQTIYQLGSTLDDLLFGSVMELQGVSDAVASSILGVYNTQYNQMTTLPVAITTAMAATLLPGIALLRAQGRRKEAQRKVQTAVKWNMALAIPAAVGLAVLARPIMELLFPRLTEYRMLSVRMLQCGSFAVVFYALSTITAAVLQGSDHMHAPVGNAALALAGHVFLVYGLLRYTGLGVYSLIIGNVTFPMLLSLLNCRSISKKLHNQWEFRRTFLIPLLASVPMGLLAWGAYQGLSALHLELPWALLLSVLAAAGFYVVAVTRLGCFTRSEFAELPMGGLLARIAGCPKKR